MKKTVSPLLLLVLLLTTGCLNKEEDITGPLCQAGCTVIQGQVTTGTGTVPLQGATLTLEWENTRYLAGGTIRKKAVSTTDMNGNYRLAFQVRDDEVQEGFYKLDIKADTSRYFLCASATPDFDFSHLQRDTTIEVDYFVPRKAFVELRLSNREQVKDSDYFATTVWSMVGEKSCGYVATWKSGYPAIRVAEVGAEQPVVVDTRKTKDGVQSVTVDTLYLSVGQRVVRNIEF